MRFKKANFLADSQPGIEETNVKELIGLRSGPTIVLFESFEVIFHFSVPRTTLIVPLILVNSCPFVVELFCLILQAAKVLLSFTFASSRLCVQQISPSLRGSRTRKSAKGIIPLCSLRCAPGRAQSLGGASPLQARQRELLAGRQGCPSRGGI